MILELSKAEKPVAHELLKKLGVGFLPAIQRVKAEGRSGTPHSALRTPQSP